MGPGRRALPREAAGEPAGEWPDGPSPARTPGDVVFLNAEDDPADTIRPRLERAGATLFLEEPQPDGSILIMMRDPWGVPLQLCQRTNPFPMP